MALRFSGFDQWVMKTTNLPSITNFTMMCWVKISVDRNAISTFLQFGKDDPGWHGYLIQGYTDGTTLIAFNGSTASGTGTNLTVGQWYHIAMTVSGTGAGQFLIYLDGDLEITHSGGTVPTAGRMTVGDWDNTGGYEPYNGCAVGLIVYNDVLSAREIREQIRQIAPVRKAGLNSFLTMTSLSNGGVNLGGSNDIWTIGGGVTEEVGPPVPFVWVQRKKYYFVGGAQLYQLSLSSSVTPATNVVKLGGKVVGSGVTLSTSLSKVVSKAISSTVTPVTNVLIVVGKGLSSGVTPVSSVIKMVGKNISSSVGVVTNLSKIVIKAPFSSSIIPVTSVIKIGVKSLSSAVTPVTSVVISVTRALVLSSVVTPVSTAVKVVSKGLSSSVGVSSEVSKVVGKMISSTVTPVSGVVKAVGKVLSSVVTPVSSLVYSAIKALFLSSNVTPITSIVKVGVKGLSSVVGVGSGVSKVVNKVLGSEVTPTTQMVKMFLQYIVLDSFVTPVTSIVTQFISGSGLPSLNSLLPIFRRRRK